MQAGRLTEDITITRPTVTQNEYGEQVTEYTEVCTARASADFEQGGSGRTEQNEEITFNDIYTFITYFHVDVKNYDHIVYNGNTYNVLFVMPNRTANYKKIRCQIINE